MKPYLDILKLVWPLALGMINNAAMQFVDRAYLARASMVSLEAILPATTLAWVFLGFFQSIVGYSGVFVAQYHGAGNDALCHKSHRVGQAAALLSAILLLPLIPLGDWIFRMTATTPELANLEASYYDITVGGGIFLIGQMATTAYFTGRGKTRLVFWVNLVGNLINIAIDPVLIFGWLGCPRLGLAGAAIATVFAQAVQFTILMIASRDSWFAARDPQLVDGRLFLRLLRFGIPAGGYEILNMLSFTIFVFITGRMDAISFAVSNACFTINYLLFAPMLGFALGVQTLVGQARGRRDNVAAEEALARTMRLALGCVLVVLVAVLAMHRPILALFAPPDVASGEAFMSLGFKLLLLMAAWIFFDAADVVLSGALKGAGDTKFVFWWMLVCSFVLWLPLVAIAFLLDASMPVMWATMVIYVVIITMGSWWRWRHGKWRAIHLVFDITRGARSAPQSGRSTNSK